MFIEYFFKTNSLKYWAFVLFVLMISESCKRKQVTFADDVATIIYNNCSKCHNPNRAAPFPLISYEDIKKRAKSIAKVTKTRYMPPWPADPSYSHFAGELVLSNEQINLIDEWVKQGCTSGDLSKLKEPVYNYKSYYGKPDLTITYKDTVFIKGDYLDKFYLLKIPYEIAQDTIIKAIEFIPGNRKLIHHVNGSLIQYEMDKKKNVNDGEAYINRESADAEYIYKELKVANDDGSFPLLTQSVINYLPGVLPTIYPEGLAGIKMKRKGAFLFKDIHYGPSSKDTFDVSTINVFYANKMPNRITRELQMGTLGITDIEPPLVIPPNKIKKFITRCLIKKDISILTINPHMHKLGKSFKAYAIKQNGDTIPLIKINNWDFNWQYFYTFKTMIKIPAGSTIIAEGIYDNTVNNKNNPFHPPQEVMERKGSMRASDEMFQFIITLTDYKNGDENISLESNNIN